MRTATLLAGAAGKGDDAFPVIVLSDDNTTVPNRTARAGRIRAEDGLTRRRMGRLRGARRAGRRARSATATGLRTVFHHHCAGYVETPQEIDALMSRTYPTLLGLCLDTGHLTYGGGDPVAAIAKYRDRIWHVHFKDCDPTLARQARARGVGLSHGRSPRHLLRARQGAWCRSPACSTRCASSTTPAGSSSNRMSCPASARRPRAHAATANTSVGWGFRLGGVEGVRK